MKDHYSEPPITGSSRINIEQTERIASVATGLLLFSLGLGRAIRLKPLGLLGVAAGAYLVNRGASGNCSFLQKLGKDSNEKVNDALVIRETMVIERPRKEVYAAWRKLEDLPKFMKHLKKVEQIDKKRSHWEANIPGGLGTSIEWEAEITDELEGEYLAWRSVWNSIVDNAGEVAFRDAPIGIGTEIQATILYRPPAGDVGVTIASYFNDTFESLLREDLRRFKDMVESPARAL
ncbi:MAG TPA: SRPBCC family protein [Bacteroidia bacterium]|jgi:uncharacterized membrane protein|nr:SRPBCC family protein [Bacteroidia bacterium]